MNAAKSKPLILTWVIARVATNRKYWCY